MSLSDCQMVIEHLAESIRTLRNLILSEIMIFRVNFDCSSYLKYFLISFIVIFLLVLLLLFFLLLEDIVLYT